MGGWSPSTMNGAEILPFDSRGHTYSEWQVEALGTLAACLWSFIPEMNDIPRSVVNTAQNNTVKVCVTSLNSLEKPHNRNMSHMQSNFVKEAKDSGGNESRDSSDIRMGFSVEVHPVVIYCNSKVRLVILK